MGYATITPYALINVASSGQGGSSITLDTTEANYSLGSLTTPNYKGTLSMAYFTLHCPTRQNTNALNSWFDSTNNGYMGFDDGGGTHSGGAIPNYSFVAPLVGGAEGGWVYSDYVVRGSVNVASLIAPNTTYTCKIMHGLSNRDSLLLFNCWMELDLYFSV